MQDQSKGSGVRDRATVERSIVLELLRDDHEEWWSRAELDQELDDAEPTLVSAALSRLQAGGVVQVEAGRMRASSGTRYLDSLDMICI